MAIDRRTIFPFLVILSRFEMLFRMVVHKRAREARTSA